MWNLQILLFSYHRNESFLYHNFKCWVSLPPNPPPMIDEEKEEATTRRVSLPPLCKYGYHSELVNPPTELNYTPFLCCSIPLSVIAHKRCLSRVVMNILLLYS
jgi:hypothetical protein